MTLDELNALDDDAVAQRAAKGDAEAMEVLLLRSAPVAARIAHGVLGCHSDALDAAQETMLRILRCLGTTWSGKSYNAWLFSCAHAAAADDGRL